MRKEKDTMGFVEVPEWAYWGAQTQRSLENFPIGWHTMPEEVIRAMVIIKKACALANRDLGVLDPEVADAIVKACDRILAGGYEKHFPLKVWQTGSGTQTNMNVNEVIRNLAHELMGGTLTDENKKVHPNDHVNRSQSSNDTFPTAMYISAYIITRTKVLPSCERFIEALKAKEKEFAKIVKIGRTHLMDAVPLTLGQEFSGYVAMVSRARRFIEWTCEHLLELPLGGTAVGTGLNTPKGFDKKAVKYISEITGYPFVPATNKFEGLASHEPIHMVHSAFASLATSLMKIANDIRWMGSGPRCGLGELILPANEPGSSIMPGKVNPTQAEALTQVVTRVMGNHYTIMVAVSQGNFELNVYKPVIIYPFIESAHLLADAMDSFRERCLEGILPNTRKIREHLENSYMLVTALNPYIGYDRAAEIVKYAHKNNTTLKEAAVALGIMTAEEFHRIVRPEKMAYPHEEALQEDASFPEKM